jgi:hypothetical protein
MLVNYGQAFEPNPLPADFRPAELGSCYLNAFLLASSSPNRLTYFEGVATTAENPDWAMPHGWCVDTSGSVIDPTWAHESVHPTAYRGLALPLNIVEPHAKTRSGGTFSALNYDMPYIAEVLGIEFA